MPPLFSLRSHIENIRGAVQRKHAHAKLRPFGHQKLVNPANPALPRPKRKIVLLGPHDRYNFGDLLFEKIVSKLLTERAGYAEEDIIRGGVVSVDMSAYGGASDILSMRRVQTMSRAAPDGPYDIVYTGGEACSCSLECAAGMMPTAELKAMVMSEKVPGNDCAYLFPKDLLLRGEAGVWAAMCCVLPR